MGWCKEYCDWEDAWAKINEHYGHYSGVHTINNAAVVVMALMYAQLDYEKSIVLAVRGGWDADCNGAEIDITDITAIISYLYIEPVGQPEVDPYGANVNGVGDIDIADITYLINFLYLGGPPPPA